MTDVIIDHSAIAEFLRSEEVRLDLRERAERVTAEAARRVRTLGHEPKGLAEHVARAMDHEPGTDEHGAYEDVSWRLGKAADGGESRGHFLIL